MRQKALSHKLPSPVSGQEATDMIRGLHAALHSSCRGGEACDTPFPASAQAGSLTMRGKPGALTGRRLPSYR